MSSLPSTFSSEHQDWAAVVNTAVRFRRSLHQDPELSWQETKTAAVIRSALDALGIPWKACADTGTLGFIAQNAKGRRIALRADIDALPIVEQSGREWCSTTQGVMHACGHDGHAATLMATAAWLKLHEDQLPGPVTLLYQPAEEGGHGAKRMIEDGALHDVDMIFGWHNWPGIPFGKAVCPDGVVMAGNGTFKISLLGKGGHASQPQACRDPVLAASAVTLALQQIVSRRLQPQSAVVVSVTSINAPSGDTIIPDKAELGGSIRLASAADRQEVNELITEIAKSAASAYGVEAIVEHFSRYDATVNHADAAALMRQALLDELGDGWNSADTPIPIMASEDFSYYLKERPGAFALIGADDGEPNHRVSCHSPEYDFNDGLIPVVTGVYSRLAGILPDRGRDNQE
ncbi:N(2)-acetyl-L-2,4-diaminobutanoate deacetylase DoeB2 [Hyphococcus flavus]|uniref:N(2)-acetyl-L-2,4-diaminobutanoate deacetylase DoeB2 n=1 Tax=Hyphococcus flavus TaxID=1866326 RepID=A0AAE9ZFZ5_9PROT|nr:N(2)-acetyl-L-2,4-diaminobutanoate deacetylase DoeB2 [Hyphococcus flavus]WDI30141.1 N(2)-acetyl-L-2,4-diaminobutanoate deacetylase DoeB2 [Hyphococcus flavus]